MNKFNIGVVKKENTITRKNSRLLGLSQKKINSLGMFVSLKCARRFADGEGEYYCKGTIKRVKKQKKLKCVNCKAVWIIED